MEFCSGWPSCVVASFLSVEDWTLNKKVLCQRFDTEGHGWAWERCRPSAWKWLQVVASPKFFGRHCLSKHKMTRYVRNLRGMVHLPSWLRLWLQEKNEKERTVLPWCSVFQTKSSQQRKTARHCGTPMKSNIVSIGCYVWLLLDYPQTEIACWNSIRLC